MQEGVVVHHVVSALQLGASTRALLLLQELSHFPQIFGWGPILLPSLCSSWSAQIKWWRKKRCRVEDFGFECFSKLNTRWMKYTD